MLFKNFVLNFRLFTSLPIKTQFWFTNIEESLRQSMNAINFYSFIMMFLGWVKPGNAADGSFVQINVISNTNSMAAANFGTSVDLSSDGKFAVVADDDGIYAYVDANSSSGSFIAQSLSGEVTATTAVAVTDDGTFYLHAMETHSSNRGKCELYRIVENAGTYSSTMTWSETGLLSNAYFGSSIALSGDGFVMAIGSYRYSDNASNAGFVKVYTCSSAGVCSVRDSLYPTEADLNFGSSVALNSDGTYLVVGGDMETSSGTGKVFVYQWDSSNYILVGTELSGTASNSRFGVSVDICDDGSIIAVGASQDSSLAGAAYVYAYNTGSGNYEAIGNVFGNVSTDEFGFSVSLSSDGALLAVGAPGGDYTNVYEYDSGSTSWLSFQTLTEPGLSLYGTSVSFSGDDKTLAIGSSASTTTTIYVWELVRLYILSKMVFYLMFKIKMQ